MKGEFYSQLVAEAAASARLVMERGSPELCGGTVVEAIHSFDAHRPSMCDVLTAVHNPVYCNYSKHAELLEREFCIITPNNRTRKGEAARERNAEIMRQSNEARRRREAESGAREAASRKDVVRRIWERRSDVKSHRARFSGMCDLCGKRIGTGFNVHRVNGVARWCDRCNVRVQEVIEDGRKRWRDHDGRHQER